MSFGGRGSLGRFICGWLLGLMEYIFRDTYIRRSFMNQTIDTAILERFQLASERIVEIPEEKMLPEGLFSYFKEVSDYLGGVS
jgi:hypothetical protein